MHTNTHTHINTNTQTGTSQRNDIRTNELIEHNELLWSSKLIYNLYILLTIVTRFKAELNHHSQGQMCSPPPSSLTSLKWSVSFCVIVATDLCFIFPQRPIRDKRLPVWLWSLSFPGKCLWMARTRSQEGYAIVHSLPVMLNCLWSFATPYKGKFCRLKSAGSPPKRLKDRRFALGRSIDKSLKSQRIIMFFFYGVACVDWCLYHNTRRSKAATFAFASIWMKSESIGSAGVVVRPRD